MNAFLIRCVVACGLLAIAPVYAEVHGGQFTSFAGFDLGTVTLSQVQDQLGVAKLVEEGDGAEYEASICYRTPFGLIRFGSGEMDGSEHYLSVFSIVGSDSIKAGACVSWPTSRAIPDLSIGGIYLGMSKVAFTNAIASEVRWENDVAFALFRSKRFMTHAELKSLDKAERQAIQRGKAQSYLDVDVTVLATFRDGKLAEFNCTKTESR